MKKFKRIFAVFFCLLLASGILGGCGKAGSSSISAPSASQSGSKPLKIVTTIFPEYDWVREILGDKADHAEVSMLLDNGVNFTDGLDGLCTSVTILVATFFTIVAIGENTGISPITGAVVGSLLGFLLFNVYPAKVFMGDTGSLALGGFVSASAFMMQMPIFIALVGLIYLVEVLSVIMQVTYFKSTGGKRIFKMAPIHHHFELCGWSETRVVAVFSIITAILCLIAYLGL